MGNTWTGQVPTISATVHPHACGEHVLNYARPELVDRFIPTPVGNTSLSTTVSTLEPVHPHACGEHTPERKISLPRVGSSPRLWGTRPIQQGPVRRYLGSSPRLWGTLDRLQSCSNSLAVHPHACGEHAALRSDLSDRAAAVHPHACGEHVPLVMPIGIHNGSSPRLWGTHYRCRPRHFTFARFIPTPVGNTSSQDIRGVTIAVHPHACGEHNPSQQTQHGRQAVHPHACGEHIPSVTSCNQYPSVHPHACGEHPALTVRRLWQAVHPHACGEHWTPTTKMPMRCGSSPRLWGTQ